jgi:hypothetical protein
MTEERPPIVQVLLGFVDEVDADVERWNLDRAYMVAGGPFLQTAHRLGWPAADRALSYVLAVRRLANMNRVPQTRDVFTTERRSRERAEEHYRAQRDVLRQWLNTPVE